MTGQRSHFRHAGRAVHAYLTDACTEVLDMVDLLLEGLVVGLSWVVGAITGPRRPRKSRARRLQVIGAMSMVNDHVLRDLGLDRPAVGAISELSIEEIDGCRVERQVS